MSLIRSYPKINLGLNVYDVGKNNKHQIMSIFVLIDQYYDEIIISESENNKITYIYDDGSVFTINNDAISSVLKYLKEKKGLEQAYTISVYKKIPFNAGLGGSSSNAGTVLKYLMKVHNIDLDFADLEDIALNIGSDIPFFASGYQIALVSNYGDEIYDLGYLAKPQIELVPFSWNTSTTEVYHQFDQLNLPKNKNNYAAIIENWNNLHQIKLHNDLLLPALMVNKKFHDFYQQLITRTNKNINMTGSGSYLYYIKK